MALIPPVGTSGIYKLAVPFATKLQSSMAYRCDAVRRLSDLLELGSDPYEDYYQPNQLTRAQYEQDILNQVCIVSLVSEAGHWVYVPSTFILSYPDINGIDYTVMVLGVEIGAVPRYRDLTGVKQAVANLVRDTLGVNPQIREVSISAVQKLSQADHDAAEAARQQLINNSQTDRARYLALEAANNSLRLQVQQLEDYIRQNGL